MENLPSAIRFRWPHFTFSEMLRLSSCERLLRIVRSLSPFRGKLIQTHDEPRLNPKQPGFTFVWVQAGTWLCIQAERERLFTKKRRFLILFHICLAIDFDGVRLHDNYLDTEETPFFNRNFDLILCFMVCPHIQFVMGTRFFISRIRSCPRGASGSFLTRYAPFPAGSHLRPVR